MFVNYASKKKDILLRLIEELIYGLVEDPCLLTSLQPKNRPTLKERDQKMYGQEK